MKFIDQAPAYNVKSLSLTKAIQDGRARLTVGPDGKKSVACFRPQLDVANAFDRDINKRVNFNALPTPEKLDLMIGELLPGFFHADKLADTGRDHWVVSFLIDGNVRRTLMIDINGVRAVEETDEVPAFELETDVMTLMAVLRSVIADFHLKKLDPGAL